MLKRNRKVVFRKRHFVKTIHAVRRYLLNKFGYSQKPFIIETALPKFTLMSLMHKNSKYAILYDYKQFKKEFGSCDFHTQEAYAASIMAHEMRHYYQHRQMFSKNPVEDIKTLKRWIKNEKDVKLAETNGFDKYVTQPLEVDASLFEYVFGANIYDKLLIRVITGKKQYKKMKKLYTSYFGKLNPELFTKEVDEYVKNR